MDPEICERAEYLAREFGETPNAENVPHAGLSPLKADNREVVVDRIEGETIRQINRGPVQLASLLVALFYTLGLDIYTPRSPAYAAVGSSVILLGLSGFLFQSFVRERRRMEWYCWSYYKILRSG